MRRLNNHLLLRLRLHFAEQHVHDLSTMLSGLADAQQTLEQEVDTTVLRLLDAIAERDALAKQLPKPIETVFCMGYVEPGDVAINPASRRTA